MKKITTICLFILMGYMGLSAQFLLNAAPAVVMQTTAISQNSTAVATSTDENSPKFTVNAKRLTITNLEVGATIDVYSVLGKKVHSFVYKGNVETLNLNKGIYIIRTGKFSQKIIL